MKYCFAWFMLPLVLMLLHMPPSLAVQPMPVKRGPHGGCVKQSGAYVVELVLKEDNVEVYVLDATSHTMNTSAIHASVLPIINPLKIHKPFRLQRFSKGFTSTTFEKRPVCLLVWIRLGDARILTVFGKKDVSYL